MKKEIVVIMLIILAGTVLSLTSETITIQSPSQTYYATNSIEVNISLTESVEQLNITMNGATQELCKNCNANTTIVSLQKERIHYWFQHTMVQKMQLKVFHLSLTQLRHSSPSTHKPRQIIP